MNLTYFSTAKIVFVSLYIILAIEKYAGYANRYVQKTDTKEIR